MLAGIAHSRRSSGRRKLRLGNDQICPSIALLEIERKVSFGGIFNLRSEKENEMKTKMFIPPHRYVPFVAVLALSSFALAQHAMQHDSTSSSANLVQVVRAATEQYLNVNNATAAGYGALFGCVSGSDHGAMGIHYVNNSLLNGTVDVTKPPALIYEPQPNGQMKLVGVEYIADQAT
jgi:hypothetical protein